MQFQKECSIIGLETKIHVFFYSLENKNVEIQAVGAGAANQAIKSIAVARGYLAPIGIDLICIPAFTSIQIDGEDRTAIKLICEPR